MSKSWQTNQKHFFAKTLVFFIDTHKQGSVEDCTLVNDALLTYRYCLSDVTNLIHIRFNQQCDKLGKLSSKWGPSCLIQGLNTSVTQ